MFLLPPSTLSRQCRDSASMGPAGEQSVMTSSIRADRLATCVKSAGAGAAFASRDPVGYCGGSCAQQDNRPLVRSPHVCHDPTEIAVNDTEGVSEYST